MFCGSGVRNIEIFSGHQFMRGEYLMLVAFRLAQRSGVLFVNGEVFWQDSALDG